MQQRCTAGNGLARCRPVRPAPLHPVLAARATAHPLLDLQHTAGNRAVQRLARAGRPRGSPVAFPAADRDEMEADRVARQVRSPAGPMVRPSAPSTERAAAPPVVDEILRSAGQPLNPATRAFFEPRFGYDFGDVRIHTGNRASESARALHAVAYTAGPHIVFSEGAYAPGTTDGQRVLAHELTHVVQQGAAAPLGAAAPATPRRESRIQRLSFENCDNEQTRNSLVAAVGAALSDLDAAIGKLAMRPLGADVRDALWLAFRDDSTGAADKVMAGLTAIKTRLPGATLECTPLGSGQCDKDVGGYVWSWWGYGFGNIHVCTDGWKEVGGLERTHTVIHEASHRFLDTGDKGYFAGCMETSATRSLPASDRLDNADSYACFVQNVVHASPEDLATRAAVYKSPALALYGIEQINPPSGVIDMSTAPYFKLDTEPGFQAFFQYRWVIEDPNGGRYLMASATDGNPFRYGQYPVVYIPAGTREVLRTRQITNATILCRVLFPSGETRLFSLAVEFKP